jgi:thiamine-phosphate pyrophosphorylase
VSRPALDLSLYLVLDQGLCGDRSMVDVVRAAVRGGVSLVQVREPRASTRQLCRIAEAVHGELAGTGVPLLINDRLDVALAIGAEGMHVGQSDLPAPAARRIAGADLLIGLSVSSLAEVEEALAMPAGTVDYLGLSPVFGTPTKPEAGPGVGLDGARGLRIAAKELPCVAIGGINAENARSVWETGVAGLAVVSAICAATDPQAAAEALARIAPRAEAEPPRRTESRAEVQ